MHLAYLIVWIAGKIKAPPEDKMDADKTLICALSACVQAANAVRAGAISAIIANNNANGYFRLTPDTNAASPTVPIFSVPYSTYTVLSAAILTGAALKLQYQTYTLPSCTNSYPQSA